MFWELVNISKCQQKKKENAKISTIETITTYFEKMHKKIIPMWRFASLAPKIKIVTVVFFWNLIVHV